MYSVTGQDLSSIASAKEEYGGRNSEVRMPAAPASTSWFCVSSQSMRDLVWYARSGWLKVCRPISWPSATIRRTRSGWREAIVPVTKKTACASYSFSLSRTLGVHSGSGPSSKVSTSLWSGTFSALGVVVPRASMTGPPLRIRSGTWSVAAGGVRGGPPGSRCAHSRAASASRAGRRAAAKAADSAWAVCVRRRDPASACAGRACGTGPVCQKRSFLLGAFRDCLLAVLHDGWIDGRGVRGSGVRAGIGAGIDRSSRVGLTGVGVGVLSGARIGVAGVRLRIGLPGLRVGVRLTGGRPGRVGVVRRAGALAGRGRCAGDGVRRAGVEAPAPGVATTVGRSVGGGCISTLSESRLSLTPGIWSQGALELPPTRAATSATA